jgi:hypothetical protein
MPSYKEWLGFKGLFKERYELQLNIEQVICIHEMEYSHLLFYFQRDRPKRQKNTRTIVATVQDLRTKEPLIISLGISPFPPASIIPKYIPAWC